MLAPLVFASMAPLKVLFVGNSLLNYNDVPLTVAKMLESDGSGRNVTFKAHFVGHLEDIPSGSPVDRDVTSGEFNIVVLQGAMVSSSMKYTYSQNRGIAMAKAARAAKSRVLLYVEWPRRGKNETEYTLDVYRGIARISKAEIVRVGYVWNAMLTKASKTSLWQADGNHATPAGSFVAAACTYFQIAGTKGTPTYRPRDVDSDFAKVALEEARKI